MPRKSNVHLSQWPISCSVMGSHFNPSPLYITLGI